MHSALKASLLACRSLMIAASAFGCSSSSYPPTVSFDHFTDAATRVTPSETSDAANDANDAEGSSTADSGSTACPPAGTTIATFVISPAAATVQVLGTINFTLSESGSFAVDGGADGGGEPCADNNVNNATWSVEETSGGVTFVDEADGHTTYTAPAVPGTYHIQVNSSFAPNPMQVIAVTVTQ